MQTLIKKACLYWAYLSGMLLLLVVVITVINICAFALDKVAQIYGLSISGLSGYEDFVKLSMSCIALMFFPWVQAQRGHISIDFFADKFPSKWQERLNILWLFLTLILSLFLGILMFLGMLESRNDNELTGVLEWVEWPFYFPGIISLFLWTIVLIYQIFVNKGEKLK